MDPCINLIHDSIHATNLNFQTPSLTHLYIMHGLMNQLTNIYPTSFSEKIHLVLSTHKFNHNKRLALFREELN